MIFIFWVLSFKPTFSLSSVIKRLFGSSWLSAINEVLSAYLRLLVFLPAILIPACAKPSPAFHMMYSAYKLNKQGDNIQPWRTPFPIWNQPTLTSWCKIALNWVSVLSVCVCVCVCVCTYISPLLIWNRWMASCLSWEYSPPPSGTTLVVLL